jgi:betaine lipid synthase
MDHMDWFTPGSKDVEEEIDELLRVVAPGGLIFWRSAGRKPWYNAVYVVVSAFVNLSTPCLHISVRFERKGFKVTALAVRQGPKTPIDRVNMCVNFPFGG